MIVYTDAVAVPVVLDFLSGTIRREGAAVPDPTPGQTGCSISSGLPHYLNPFLSDCN